ncbi:MAG: ATP-binding protein, partial [Candidatus Polarisedimenticolia bacterium]
NRSVHHDALRDLFETQAQHPASDPDSWFLGTLGVGLVFITMLYCAAFAWLGQTPWAFYASKSWPITPSWTAIIAIIGLAGAQVFIARINECRAAELAVQDKAAVREEAKGVVNLLGRELRRALAGSLQTAQELETGWEENPAVVKQISNIVADMHHEPGNWIAQAVREGRPLTGADLTVCQGAINFVKARLKEQCTDIPAMFDFTPQTLPVGQAARRVEEYVKTHFASLESYSYIDLDVQVDQGVRTMSDMEVSLILGQLRSVLRNLVANSVQAIERLYRRAADAQFRRKIVVRITFDRDLAISVIDEGGGFQPEIIGDIYVTGVASSKKRVGGGARIGEGTMLIKFFAGLMGATIVADNVTSADGHVGASTKILFPAHPRAGSARGGDANTERP